MVRICSAENTVLLSTLVTSINERVERPEISTRSMVCAVRITSVPEPMATTTSRVMPPEVTR
jgi:hypothetical protein